MNLLPKKSANNVVSVILEQLKDVEACLKEFTSFMLVAVDPSSDYSQLEIMASKVSQLEKTCDASLRKMIDSLNATLLPGTRRELIDIATLCDEVANNCQNTALMMVYQNFRFPVEFSEDLMRIMELTGKQMTLLMNAVSKLYTEFGKLLKDHSILDEIRAVETEVDDIEEKLIKITYSMDIGLAEKMQMAKFLNKVADVSDIIEDVSDAIQICLIMRKS